MESALADSVPHCNLKDRANVFVLCPFRHVSLYKGTRLDLLRLGFVRAQVSRRDGYDGKGHNYLPRCKYIWLCSKCTCRAHPNLDVIFMLEGDCRITCLLDGL